MTNVDAGGWRYIFWIQAALHGITSAGLFAFYWPPTQVERQKLSLKEIVWACDPIGSVLFMTSTTLLLVALDYAGGTYAWSDPHVAVPLSLGLAVLIGFIIYGMKAISPITLIYIMAHSPAACTSE